MRRVTLASNPCRLRYFATETVVFRADLLQKMRRNCILPPSEHETPIASQHLVKTLLDQVPCCVLCFVCCMCAVCCAVLCVCDKLGILCLV